LLVQIISSEMRAAVRSEFQGSKAALSWN